MRILLLGKDGQVGRELSRILLTVGQVNALGKKELDLTKLEAIQKILGCLKPNIIVNAAAYTAVDKAESQSEEAYKVNHEAVAHLAYYAKKNNAILVHYSTDYVFDGVKQGAYLENDKTNPLNIYGASKLAGEEAILQSKCKGYIFRTSWVYSLYGTNFIKTILDFAQHKEMLTVIHDQKGAPTSSELISDVTLLALHGALREQLAPGIYHLTPNGVTTWYDLACYIVKQTKLNGVFLKLDLSKIAPISSEDYLTSAIRPKNSILNNDKLASCVKIIFPDWREHVNRLIQQLIQIGYFNEA